MIPPGILSARGPHPHLSSCLEKAGKAQTRAGQVPSALLALLDQGRALKPRDRGQRRASHSQRRKHPAERNIGLRRVKGWLKQASTQAACMDGIWVSSPGEALLNPLLGEGRIPVGMGASTLPKAPPPCVTGDCPPPSVISPPASELATACNKPKGFFNSVTLGKRKQTPRLRAVSQSQSQ